MFIYVCASAAEFVPLELPDWTEQLKDAVPLQTRRGSLVILHNALIHYSNENNSGQVGIYLCSSLYQLSGRLHIFYKFIYLCLGYSYTYTPYIHTLILVHIYGSYIYMQTHTVYILYMHIIRHMTT